MKKKEKKIGGYDIKKIKVGESIPVDDLMLFGKTREQNAHYMATGKLSVDTFMNEWYRKYLDDLKQ